MATANSLINSHLFLHCEDRSPSAFLSLVQQVEFQIPNPSLSFNWCLHGDVWETELLGPVLRLFLCPYPLPYSFAFPLIKVPASWLGFLHVFCLGLKDVSSCNAKISLESVQVVGLAACCAFAITIRMYPEEPSGTREDERHEGKTQSCRAAVQSKTNPADSDLWGKKPTSVSVTAFWGFVLCTIIVAKANALKM